MGSQSEAYSTLAPAAYKIDKLTNIHLLKYTCILLEKQKQLV